MSDIKKLTSLEVNELVFYWYKNLDVHAPVDDLVPLLASDSFRMVFPEATLTTVEEFKEWYKTVTHRFFDEIHDMKMLDIVISGEEASVKLVVNWQAKIWNPPEAESIWLGFDAFQSWTVKRDVSTGKAVISEYVVDKLDAMIGSAEL